MSLRNAKRNGNQNHAKDASVRGQAANAHLLSVPVFGDQNPNSIFQQPRPIPTHQAAAPVEPQPEAEAKRKTLSKANGKAPAQRAYSIEEIAALAYRLWEERGCPTGSPERDWFLAIHRLSLR